MGTGAGTKCGTFAASRDFLNAAASGKTITDGSDANS
jgi:hypothetical protein